MLIYTQTFVSKDMFLKDMFVIIFLIKRKEHDKMQIS
jgi:hypothetical protein